MSSMTYFARKATDFARVLCYSIGMYIELILLDNFIVDALILSSAAWSTGLHTAGWRIAVSSAVGALYAGAVLLLGGWLDAVLVRVAVSLGMTILVFPPLPVGKFITGTAAFWLFSFLYGGVILGCNALLDGKPSLTVHDGLRPLLIGTVVFLVIVQIAMRRRRVRDASRIEEVVLTKGRRTVVVRALVDSGNLLREPLTHAPMLIVEYNAVKSLFNDENSGFPVTCQTSAGPTTIRCVSVGGMRFSASRVRYSRICIGLTETSLSDDGSYQALLPPSLL